MSHTVGTAENRVETALPSLYDRFRSSVTTNANRVALKAEGGAGRSYTYAEVDQLVRRGAEILASYNDTAIGLIGENKPEWPISYLAILAAGKTVVPIDPNLKPAEISKIVHHAGLDTIITSNKAAASLSELPKAIRLLHLDSSSSNFWITGSPTGDVGVVPSEVAVIIYTSGTTGDPKAVELTHRNLLANMEGIEDALRFDARDTFLSVLPLHHTFEASCGFLTPLFSGSCIVYARSLKSRDILEDIAANKITIMCGVPLLYEKMYHSIGRELNIVPLAKRAMFWGLFGVSRFLRLLSFKAGVALLSSFRQKAGLGSIRMFVSGGAPLPKSVSRFFNLVGFEFLQGYGLTECSPVVSVNRPDDNRFGSVGPPLSNVEIRIDLPGADGVGEICVRAESTTRGYRANPEATSALIRDGWLYTGDLGRIHRGHLWITGRAKNVIISAAGKNIYPEEIEEKLLESAYVLEAVVVGRKQANGGEVVWAVVVPDLERFVVDFGASREHPDEKTLRETLSREIAQVNAHSADYKRIVGFDVSLQELEKTSTKKIRRQFYAATQIQSTKQNP